LRAFFHSKPLFIKVLLIFGPNFVLKGFSLKKSAFFVSKETRFAQKESNFEQKMEKDFQKIAKRRQQSDDDVMKGHEIVF
jgi:F0F1-type ATP synthase assembly protein I